MIQVSTDISIEKPLHSTGAASSHGCLFFFLTCSSLELCFALYKLRGTSAQSSDFDCEKTSAKEHKLKSLRVIAFIFSSNVAKSSVLL